MDVTTGTKLNQLTLENCADEPIRTPGLIQPHGFFLALKDSDLRVTHLSENCIDLFAQTKDELLGSELQSLVLERDWPMLSDLLKKADFLEINPIKVRFRGRKEDYFDLIVHRNTDRLLLDIEKTKSNESPSFSGIYQLINRTINSLETAQSISDLCQIAANQVLEISQYARVMIYRFDESWNGKVVAEAKNESVSESFLGLHFPSTDIPAQARDLYRTNWLRIIPNSEYKPVPIYPLADPSSDSPLDLSYSVIRSVSPIHLKYLQNMGVNASMSISIIKDGELWGLIACHDIKPNYLAYEVRQGLEFIGRFFSSQIAAKEKFENIGYKKKLRSVQSELFINMKKEKDFLDGLYRYQTNILDLAEGCTGAVIFYQGKIHLIGNTPNSSQLQQLLNWAEKELCKLSVFVTDRLSQYLPEARDYKDKVSGLMSISIPEIEPSYIMLFKPEAIQTVSWSGKPDNQNADSDDHQHISPRRSFALWQEKVEFTSMPWAPEEIEIADLLRQSIIEVDLKRQIAAAMSSNEELEHFAYVVAHDLKEPLRGISTFAGFLQEDLAGKLDSESMTNLRDIKDLSEKAKNLINELYQYSKVGTVDLSFDEVDLEETLNEVLQRLKSFIQEHKTEIRRPARLPKLWCDKVRVKEVFSNLITNAIKYNDKDHKWVEIVSRDKKQGVEFSVCDNGIGIEAGEQERVFRMFERLHESDQFGGGTGAGLAIVKRIIDRHGGYIEIESTVGKGSCFNFSLSPSTALSLASSKKE